MSTSPQGAVYTLDVLDWSAAIGGRHLTAKLHWEEGPHQSNGSHYHHHELERDLSLKDAKLLDPDMGDRYWRLGGTFRKSNRFETMAQLERHATRWVKADAERRKESVWLLIDNDHSNPNRPIAAQGWDKDRLALMTDLAEVWDKTPNHLRDFGSTGVKAIYLAWKALILAPDSLGDVRPIKRTLASLKRTTKSLAKR